MVQNQSAGRVVQRLDMWLRIELLTQLIVAHFASFNLSCTHTQISYINMQPHLILLADVRDLLYGVEGALNCRARGAVDEEGDVALGLSLDHQPLQLRSVHATSGSQIRH